MTEATTVATAAATIGLTQAVNEEPETFGAFLFNESARVTKLFCLDWVNLGELPDALEEMLEDFDLCDIEQAAGLSEDALIDEEDADSIVEALKDYGKRGWFAEVTVALRNYWSTLGYSVGGSYLLRLAYGETLEELQNDVRVIVLKDACRMRENAEKEFGKAPAAEPVAEEAEEVE